MFKKIQWAAVFLGIASIEAALLYKLIASQVAISQTQMLIAICTLGVFLFLASNVDNLKSIVIGKAGVKVELEVLKEKPSENEQAIIDLILGSMGDDTYKNFTKFDRRSGFGKYIKKHNEGLETELYYLRNLGYIEFIEKKEENIHSIFGIPESGEQLSYYFRVTETGRKYIELREKYEPKR